MVKKFIGPAVALVAVLGTTALAPASDLTVVGEPSIIESSSTSSVSNVSQLKLSTKYKHVGTFVAVSKSKVNRKECFWATGTWTNTTRHNGGAIKRYRETSRARFCELKKPTRVGGVTYRHVKVAGGLTGTPCWNYAIPPGKRQPKPQLRGSVLDSKTLTFKVSVKIKASATASATATCTSGTSSASSSAYGKGSASATLNFVLRAKNKSQAKVKGAKRVSAKQETKIEMKAQGNARVDLSTSATAKCSGGKVIVTPPTPPSPPTPPVTPPTPPAKDGTKTPPPPAEAPGPNPAPHPDDPTVTPDNPSGSWQCYEEGTNDPVNPRSDGTCPPGSWGGPK